MFLGSLNMPAAQPPISQAAMTGNLVSSFIGRISLKFPEASFFGPIPMLIKLSKKKETRKNVVGTLSSVKYVSPRPFASKWGTGYDNCVAKL